MPSTYFTPTLCNRGIILYKRMRMTRILLKAKNQPFEALGFAGGFVENG